jgi:hypothetical protein
VRQFFAIGLTFIAAKRIIKSLSQCGDRLVEYHVIDIESAIAEGTSQG